MSGECSLDLQEEVIEVAIPIGHAFDHSGTVAGNRLQWEMKVTKPMRLTLMYELEIAGNTLSGKVKLGMFGTAKVSGERIR